METIIIQMSENRWTLQAVHFACAMTNNHQANIILLRLDYVQHPSYLGSEFGYTDPTIQEADLFATCQAIAEQYGLSIRFESIQCATRVGALVAAADEFFGDLLLAPIRAYNIPLWYRFQIWNLTRQLSAVDCQFFTLDQPSGVMPYFPEILRLHKFDPIKKLA